MIMKQFDLDKLHIAVFDTRKAMGDAAGHDAAEAIRKALSEKDTINVMFAAAPSQNETLAALLSEEGIAWNRINAFHMDEYVGLSENHPAGFRNFLKRAIFDKKPFKSVNLLNGNAEDPEKEAARYSQLLKDNPLDVCLLGIGENGHIAFNDPPVADFNDKTFVKIVELEQRCREQQVHDGCFEKLEQVPTHALTVTIPGLVQAKAMFCSVPAATKAEAVYKLVNRDISEACPCTILRRHENAYFYADKDSGKDIL